jgi:hypothetical protein
MRRLTQEQAELLFERDRASASILKLIVALEHMIVVVEKKQPHHPDVARAREVIRKSKAWRMTHHEPDFSELVEGDLDAIANHVEVQADDYFVRIDCGDIEAVAQFHVSVARKLIPALGRAIKEVERRQKKE